jgi:hypothetical protein
MLHWEIKIKVCSSGSKLVSFHDLLQWLTKPASLRGTILEWPVNRDLQALGLISSSAIPRPDA